MDRTVDALHHNAPSKGHADLKPQSDNREFKINVSETQASGKSKEEILAEEVRAASDIGSRTLQWGVTLMISLQTALFFIRRDILSTLIDAGKLPKGSELPITRYLIGTVFLFIVATILSRFGARTAKQYRHYKAQLINSRQSGITDLPIKNTARWMYVLYFIFPVIDILSRLYIDIRLQ